MKHQSNIKQTGLVTVEFALIGAIFFLVLLGIIEIGRLLFTWNVLDEVTRRAARMAVVCPMGQVENVKRSAVFNGSVLGPQLTTAHIDIQYLKDNINPADPATAVEDVRYVQTSIVDFEYQMLIPDVIPGLPLNPFNALSFITTLPSESLGVTPDGSWDVLCTGA